MRASLSSIILAFLILVVQATPVGAQRVREREKPEEAKRDIDPRSRTRLDMMYVDACTEMIRGDIPAATALFQKLLKEDAGNHAAMYNLGKMAFEQRLYDDAIQYGGDALAKDPANYWYYRLLEQAYEAKGNFSKAIEVQEKMIALFPGNARDRLRLADLYRRSKDPQRAIGQLRQIETDHGVSEETAFLMYDLYMEQNQPDQALTVAQKLLALDDRDERFYKMAFDAHMKAGRSDAAAASLAQLLENDAENGFALLTLAAYYKQSGDLIKSGTYLDRAFANPELSATEKVDILREMIDDDASAPETMPRIARLTDMLRRYHPDVAETYSLQGDFFSLNKQWDSAYIAYDQALERKAADIRVWIHLLESLEVQEKYDLLRDRAEESREYYPNSGEILYFNGLAYARTGENKSAVRMLDRVVRLGTASPQLVAKAYGELGRISLAENAYPEAEQQLIQAIDRLPSPDLLELYGDVLMQMGKKDEALRQWKRAIESGGEKNRIEPKMQGH